MALFVENIPAAVIGGGPAGLMAAEMLLGADVPVVVFDAMPSPGRKFLMAGKGGMNITHSEPAPAFLSRYGTRQAEIAPWLEAFGAEALRNWIHGLGVETFVGTSGRVFPTEMKAAPLLRKWLHRLRQSGGKFHVRHRWTGWQGDALCFMTPHGERRIQAGVTILALGGGSWARLGSDGAWVPVLQRQGVAVAPLQPANCGFEVAWSRHFCERFAGHPVKAVVASMGARQQQGEFNVTEAGLEGGLIYAFSAPLRDALAAGQPARLFLDLAPGRSTERLLAELSRPRGRDSLANHLRRRVGMEGVKAGLLRELLPEEVFADPQRLAAAIKSLPVPVLAPRPLDEAISTAGGVLFEELDENLMLRSRPGVFCAGEMLDWEAPTGGYLLTACFASGRTAGLGARQWLANAAGQPRL